jgi:hypothetical protein
MWCVPEVDEAYLRQMENLLKLYEKPYIPQEPVVCLDEKPVPLHAEVRPPMPPNPASPPSGTASTNAVERPTSSAR